MAGSYELVYRVSRGRKEPDDTNVRINVSPPSCRDNWPLSWFIDFFFPSLLENYIYKYFKRREKRGEGEEERGTFRELEKSLSHKYLFRYDRMCVTFMRECCVATNFSLEALINGINLSRILRLNETIENTFHVCKIYNSCSTFVRNARIWNDWKRKIIEDKISIDSLARFSRSGRDVYETSVSGLVPRNVPVFKQRGVGAAYHPLQFD